MTPGIHSLSSEAYHSASGVSRSMLEWLTPPNTPAHFRAKYIDKLIPDEETPALVLGALTHRSILEPDTMAGAFHVKPEGMNFATKEGKEWKASHENRPIISSESAVAITGMRNAVWSHPDASKILKQSDFERSAFVEEDGLLLKARFDALPRKGNVIADLKTCENADQESVDKAMHVYGYHRQACFYQKVARLLGMERDYFVFIFVEKSPPFAVACYTPEDIFLEHYGAQIAHDLQLLRNCYAEDRWPGYPLGINGCGVPGYVRREIEKTQPRA